MPHAKVERWSVAMMIPIMYELSQFCNLSRPQALPLSESATYLKALLYSVL